MKFNRMDRVLKPIDNGRSFWMGNVLGSVLTTEGKPLYICQENGILFFAEEDDLKLIAKAEINCKHIRGFYLSERTFRCRDCDFFLPFDPNKPSVWYPE